MRNVTWLIIGMIFWSVGVTGYSQSDFPYDLPQYNFVKYDKNVFNILGDSVGYFQLFQKIDTLLIYGRGKINVVHIGGSHIQADLYTQEVREQLQLMAQGVNGGRGMIFPFKMAGTNNPWNYTVFYEGPWSRCKNTTRHAKCPLGLTGMSVTTHDTMSWFSIGINAKTNVKYEFDRVKIFYDVSDSNSFKPAVRNDVKIISDSINYELGYREFVFEKTADQITFDFKKTSAMQKQFTLYGLYFGSDEPGFLYSAIGVNGAKFESFLQCEKFIPHLKAVNPDWVIISIGTNDAYTRYFNKEKFKQEYIQLIQNIKQASPNAAILLTVPNDSYLYKRYNNKNTAVQEKVIFELAKEYNCAVWDFYEIMGGINSSQAWYYSDLMKYDRIHFNAPGYYFKGKLFYNAFLKLYDNHIERNMLNLN